MATKKSAQSYLRQQFGKKSANTILNKLDRLGKKGASVSKVEKVLARELEAHIQANILPALNRGVRSGVKEAVPAAVRAVRSTVPPASIPKAGAQRKGSK
jgi:citrate lyase gamma subunit